MRGTEFFVRGTEFFCARDGARDFAAVTVQ